MIKAIVISSILFLFVAVGSLLYLQIDASEKSENLEKRLSVAENALLKQIELNTIQKEMNAMTVDALTSVTNILMSN